IGALAALWLIVSALRRLASLWLALFAVAVSAGTVGVYAWQASRLAASLPDDISTDLAEVPGFGPLAARRGGGGPQTAGGVEACPGAVPAPTQVPPGSAAWALQES